MFHVEQFFENFQKNVPRGTIFLTYIYKTKKFKNYANINFKNVN